MYELIRSSYDICDTHKHAAFHVCVTKVDTHEELMQIINWLKNQFPDAYINEAGNLIRRIDMEDELGYYEGRRVIVKWTMLIMWYAFKYEDEEIIKYALI